MFEGAVTKIRGFSLAKPMARATNGDFVTSIALSDPKVFSEGASVVMCDRKCLLRHDMPSSLKILHIIVSK
jgi:hypothetical protein